ncbi:hypothetical protein V6N13_089526 [Hibiscus sabdariffa]|uniref:Uncharacterized protein n=1 Tax=Hibiscus sabdariffa TaxID=183260 RepID=A0ABR2QJY1_9ROSI
MVRAPFYDKNGLKKGEWSREEDDKLRSYIQRFGHWNWRLLPKFAGLKRCGKSCRLRWMNYLRPELKHGNFTEEEDALIIKLHEQYGNRWSTIVKSLPGRTDNDIKNHWHTHLKKRTKQNSTTSDVKDNSSCQTEGEAERILIDTPANMILESSPWSPVTSSTTELSSFSSGSGRMSSFNAIGGLPPSEIYEAQGSGDFWTEPFVADNIYDYNQDGGNSSSLKEGGFHMPLPFDDMCYEDYAYLIYDLMQV